MKLNSFQLKWIAIITMAIDHTGAVLFPDNMAFRCIGRIAFPIFCFLLAEGFFHTRDIRKYMLRLGIFAILSEIPYDLAFFGEIVQFEHQNVFFTLLLGVIMMYALEKSPELPIKIIDVLLVMWFSVVMNTDYSYKGILLITIYYVLRKHFWPKLFFGSLWNFIWNGTIQRFGAAASVPIALYNGERGPGMKYFFYIFYPAHLLILYLLKIVLM